MKWSSQLSAVWIAILFIILISVITGLSFYWTFHRVVPPLDGSVRLTELHNRVTIQWDAYQVPHVLAQQETDLYVTMGYLHARDRLWQMTRQQYKLEGLHSRELGEGLMAKDMFYLTMSFGQTARVAYEGLSQQDKAHLEAYAHGVNSFVRKNRKHLPPEFSLSDVKPLDWEPWHSVGVLLLWHWNNQQSFWSKLALTSLQHIDDEMLIRALTGADVPGEILFGPEAPTLHEHAFQSLMDDYLNFTNTVVPAVAGYSGVGLAMTLPGPDQTGLLTYSRESLMTIPDGTYEMVLQSDRGWRSGVTIPGLPAMIAGQNEYLAWALMPIVTDDGDFFTGRLFREPTGNPTDWEQDPTVTYRLDEKVTVERHILNLRNGGEKQLVLKKASGKPVVAISEEFNRFLAFDWAGSSHSTDFGSLRAISTSRSPSQLVDAAESMTSTALQLLYGTADGQTGRISAGRMLVSPYPLGIADSVISSLSVPASRIIPHVRHATGAPVTFLDQPASARPAVGNKCLFSPPWDRALRIGQLIDQTPPDRLLSDATLHWHNDTYSSFAAELTPHITGVLELAAGLPDSDPMLELVIPYLKNWNYEFGPNETAATLFQLFFHRAASNLYMPWIDEPAMKRLFITPHIPQTAVSSLLLNPHRWPDTHPYSFQEWISSSMSEAVGFLSDRYGTEPFDWQWTRVLDGTFAPILFDETRITSLPARLAERNLFQPQNITVSGSAHTLNSMQPGFDQTLNISAATTHKRVMVLHPHHSYHSILSTGQSGNLFSGHFSDQLILWNDGLMKESVTLPSSEIRNIDNTQYLLP